MAKRTGILTIMTAALLFLGASESANAQTPDSVSVLPGYSTMTVSAEFESYLRDNYNLRRALASDDKLSKKVLSDKGLQDQLRNGDITLFELRRALAKDNSQDVDNKGIEVKPNQSARAKRNLERAQAIIAGEARAKAGAEVAEVAQERQEALAKLMKDLAEDDPKALALFMQNTQMQQNIIDGAVSIEDAMAQLNVKLEEEETLALATDAQATAEASEETEAVNINRIPTPAEAELDANGWPKYLNVPADCPGPRADAKYIHEARKGPNGKHTALLSWPKHKRMGVVHSSYFRTSNWYYVQLEDPGNTDHFPAAEEIAAPLLTPNREVGWNQHGMAPGNGGNANMVMQIAHCPGDFTNFTPEGKTPLKKNDCNNVFKYRSGTEPGKKALTANQLRVEVKHGDQVAFSEHSCKLNPKERYFVNVRPLKRYIRLLKDEGGGENIAQSVFDYAETAADEAIIATTEFATVGSRSDYIHDLYKMPPYVGACVDSAPYPPNYSGAHSSFSPNRSGSTCGSRVETYELKPDNQHGYLDMAGPDADHCGDMTSYKRIWKCYDPEDKLPPQDYIVEYKCNNSVMTRTWLEGYGKPAYQSYVCEHYYNEEDVVLGNAKGGPVCAAGRANRVREVTSTTNASNVVIKTLQQCQFDEEMGRYEWFNISSGKNILSTPRQGVAALPDRDYPGKAYETSETRDVCVWDGKEYPLGTVMTQTNTTDPREKVVNEQYVCAQRAAEPALPRFAHVDTGYAPLKHEYGYGPPKTEYGKGYSVEFTND